MIVIEIINHLRYLYLIFSVLKDDNDKTVDKLIKITKKCGPLAIKLLQFILSRENKINKRLHFVFEECETHTFEYTKQVYLKHFSKEITSEYIIDSTQPIASGSIGQVYRFYSRSLNKHVAIKVKHPLININVARFIKVIKMVCALCYYFNKFHYPIIEYINNINTQLNYTQEANNLIRLKEKWKNEELIIVPEVYHFNDDFIIMSYHHGENYNDLPAQQQLVASLYINFIFLTSFLIHDFVHADLHTGNWKVQGNKIIMYDCGIMCSTGDLMFNRKIMEVLFSGDYIKTLDIISDENNKKRVHLCKKYIQDNFVDCPVLRLKQFIYKTLEMRLVSNKNLINILNVFVIISQIYTTGARQFNKFIDKNDNSYELMIYNYTCLLENMSNFNELKIYLQNWMDEDPSHKKIHNDWLMENFGHTRSHILGKIIYKVFFP